MTFHLIGDSLRLRIAQLRSKAISAKTHLFNPEPGKVTFVVKNRTRMARITLILTD